MRAQTLFILTTGLSLSSAALAADVEHSLGNDGPSIPHMDVSSYASQVFWLIICFGLLYFIMSKIALPRVHDILDRRHQTIQNNLEKATKIRDETEDLKIVYDKALRQADSHAQEFITRSIDDMNTKHTEKIAKAINKASDEIKKSQDTIANQKEAILKKSEKLVDDIAEDLKNKIIEIQQIDNKTSKKRA